MLELLKEDLVNAPVDPEVKNQAFVAAINDLIQKAWSFINDTRSVKATLMADYSEENLDALTGLLETVENDTTVSIGVLTELMGILDKASTVLIDAGEEKAATILNGDNAE